MKQRYWFGILVFVIGCGGQVKTTSKAGTNSSSGTSICTTTETGVATTSTSSTIATGSGTSSAIATASTVTNVVTNTVAIIGTGTETATSANPSDCVPGSFRACYRPGDKPNQESGKQYCELDGKGFTKCTAAFSPDAGAADAPGVIIINVTQVLPPEDAPCYENGIVFHTGEQIACGSKIGACHEGTKVCVKGLWTDCAGDTKPSKEICDGKDNNCNGFADEGFPVGIACNGLGVCVGGVYECNEEKNGVICSVAPDGSHNKASEERCDDNLDNNCSGVVDDGCECHDGNQRSCGATDMAGKLLTLGECRVGIMTCKEGVWPAECDKDVVNKVVLPTIETCNGKDDDCNGIVDDLWNKQNDPKNCGECGKVCDFDHAVALCVAGVCEIGKCEPLYWNANNRPKDGCEYACLLTTDGVRVCDHHDNDCNGVVDDLEWDLENDTKNCGACGNDCSFPNLGFSRHSAVDACVLGKCAVFHCVPGWTDANNNPADGCEAVVVNSDGGLGGVGGSSATGGSTSSGGTSGTGGVSGGTSGGAGSVGGASSSGGSGGSALDAGGTGGIGGSSGSSTDAGVDVSVADANFDAVATSDVAIFADAEVTDGGIIFSPEWGEPPPSQGTITCTREGPHIRVAIVVTGLLADGLAGAPPVSEAYVGAGIGADLDSCWVSSCYHKTTVVSPIVWSDNLTLTNNNTPLVADGLQLTKFTPYVITAAGQRIYFGLRSWTINGCVRAGCGMCRTASGEVCREIPKWGCIIDATASP